MISLFFMPMLPISLLAGALSIFFAHYTNKYLLYRRFSAPEATGPELCFEMYKFFDVIMMMYTVRLFWLSEFN